MIGYGKEKYMGGRGQSRSGGREIFHAWHGMVLYGTLNRRLILSGGLIC